MSKSKIGYLDNIEKITLENTNFRKVIYTGKFSQLVVMSLKPNEGIGEEVHEKCDQFFRIESGKARVIINTEIFEVEDGFAIIIPAGVKHNVINNSESKDLKLYTIYSPPNHPDGITHKDKAEAEKYENNR